MTKNKIEKIMAREALTGYNTIHKYALLKNKLKTKNNCFPKFPQCVTYTYAKCVQGQNEQNHKNYLSKYIIEKL